jgi:large subunit ribosomal protein L29
MKRKEKLAEYRGSNAEQLVLSLRELEKNLFHLRFQSATDRLETPSEIRKAKRDIARLLTIRSEKERTAKKEPTNG